jgi:hypothetical protein
MNLTHRLANRASMWLASLACKRQTTAKLLFSPDREGRFALGFPRPYTSGPAAGALVPGVSVDAINIATGVHVHGLTGSVGQRPRISCPVLKTF